MRVSTGVHNLPRLQFRSKFRLPHRRPGLAAQALLLAVVLCGCAWHRKPTPANRIILEGEPNPTIVDAPSRAGDSVRISNRPRQQARPLPMDYPQGSVIEPTNASPYQPQ